MYLTMDAMHSTLAAIAGRSASGSTLIVNYHTMRGGLIRGLILLVIGEPQISAWTPEEMATDMKEVGFIVSEDSGMLDWNRQFAGGEAKVQRGYYMRIAVAAKE